MTSLLLRRLVAASTAAAAIALLTIGCTADAPGEIVASDYDQSCQSADDCVAITTGTIGCCDFCGGDSAINKKDLDRERADVAAGTPSECQDQVCAELCRQVDVACAKNKCMVVNDASH